MIFSRRVESAGLGLLVLGTLVFLSFSYLGQNVHVLSDEVIYSIDAQHQPLSAATYPVWAYLKLFSIVRHAGVDFYAAARLLNALIFSLAIPLIYATAKHYVPDRWALLISALAVLGPINSYVAYFMPEVTYFTAFWLLSWFVLTRQTWAALPYGILVGLLCCLMNLIKPHGMFVLVAILLVQAAYALFARTREASYRAVVVGLAATASFILARLLIGYLVAGPAGLSFTGKYSQWTSNDWSKETYSSALHLAWVLLKIHGVAIAAWAGPAILAVLYLLRKGVDPSRRLLALYALAVCGLMLAICIVFSVRIVDGMPVIDAFRVHMRYYNLFFPLFFIAAAGLATSADRRRSPLTVFIGIAVAVCAAAAALPSIGRLPFLPVDAPELRGLVVAGPYWLAAMGGLSAACCLVLAFRPQLGCRLYLAAVLPLAVALATTGIHRDLNTRMTDLPVDRAGKITRSLLGTEAASLSIVGGLWQRWNARFTVNTIGTGDHDLLAGAPIPIDLVSQQARWLLVLDDRPVPSGWHFVIGQSPDWYLARRQ